MSHYRSLFTPSIHISDGPTTDCMQTELRLKNTEIMGISYNGTINQTNEGMICKRWDNLDAPNCPCHGGLEN